MRMPGAGPGRAPAAGATISASAAYRSASPDIAAMIFRWIRLLTGGRARSAPRPTGSITVAAAFFNATSEVAVLVERSRVRPIGTRSAG